MFKVFSGSGSGVYLGFRVQGLMIFGMLSLGVEGFLGRGFCGLRF